MNATAFGTSRTRNERLRKKFLIQRLIGLAMIVLAVAFVAMVSGTNEDGGAAIFLLSIGVWLLCSRKMLLI